MSSLNCEECGGKCCRYGFMNVNPADKIMIEFWEARATRVSEGRYKFYQPCPKLDLETNLCTIYETRPQFCRDFGEKECERFFSE